MGLLGTVLRLITSSTNVCFSALSMSHLTCTYDLYWMLDRRRILCVCIDLGGIIYSRYECKSFYGCMKGPGWCHRYCACLRAGLFLVRTPAGERDFPFSAPVHSGLGAQPASCTVGTGAVSWRLKRSGRGVSHPLFIAEV